MLVNIISAFDTSDTLIFHPRFDTRYTSLIHTPENSVSRVSPREHQLSHN